MFGQQKTFALLKKSQDEAAAAKDQIEKLRTRMAELEFQNGALVEGTDTASSVDTVRKRGRLRAEYEEVEGRIVALEHQIRISGEEQAQLSLAYEHLTSNHKSAIEELSRLEPGEEKDAALGRLAQILKLLSHYEQDLKYRAEAEGIERDIAERSPYYVLPEAWVRENASGKLVPESELITNGVQIYGKGIKVLKTELQQVGILGAK